MHGDELAVRVFNRVDNGEVLNVDCRSQCEVAVCGTKNRIGRLPVSRYGLGFENIHEGATVLC